MPRLIKGGARRRRRVRRCCATRATLARRARRGVPVLVPLALWHVGARAACSRAASVGRVARAGRRSGGACRRRRIACALIAVDFPDVHRRPRLLDRAPAARALRLSRRAARDRRHPARPALLPARRCGFDAFALREDTDVDDALAALARLHRRLPGHAVAHAAVPPPRTHATGAAGMTLGAAHRRRRGARSARIAARRMRPRPSPRASAPRTWCCSTSSRAHARGDRHLHARHRPPARGDARR